MQQAEETIDLVELIQILKKRLVFIIFLAFGATVISGLFTHFFMKPIYQTSTQLILIPNVNEGELLTQSEINANIQMINTFNEVIISPLILDEVIAELGLELTANHLRSMMSAGNTTNSQVITLTVQNENPQLAQQIANATAEIFKTEVENFNIDNVRILAHAKIPSRPISPRLLVNVGLGFVTGCGVGIFLSFLLEFFDKTIKTEQEIEKLIDIAVIGCISEMRAEDIIVKQK